MAARLGRQLGGSSARVVARMAAEAWAPETEVWWLVGSGGGGGGSDVSSAWARAAAGHGRQRRRRWLVGSGGGGGGGSCGGLQAASVTSPRAWARAAARADGRWLWLGWWLGGMAWAAAARACRVEESESREEWRGKREAMEARRWKRGGGSEAMGAMSRRRRWPRAPISCPCSGLIARWNTNQVKGWCAGFYP